MVRCHLGAPDIMGCIYTITNKITSAIYIGSAKNATDRWRRHISQLDNGIHHSKFLQRAWNKYGKDSFDFSIVEYVRNDLMLSLEQKYLDERKTLHKLLTYNVCWIAGKGSQLGLKRTTQQRKNISDGHKGIVLSQYSKDKLGDVLAEKNGKTYSFRSPTGEIINGIKNLRKFARNNKLTDSGIWSVVAKKQKHHKGWSLSTTELTTYELISPDGITYSCDNLKNFCIEHFLPYKQVHSALQRNSKINDWKIIRHGKPKRERKI